MEALAELEKLRLSPLIAQRLLFIVGPTYAVAALRAARSGVRKYGLAEYRRKLEQIDSQKLLSVVELTRAMRRVYLSPVAAIKKRDSARIASRIYNGLRFLGRLEPFPDGS